MANSTTINTTLTTLHKSNTGDEVKDLQSLLNRYYYGTQLEVDGYFGSETEAQVLRFQSHCLIEADGIVGPVTWSYLEEITPYSRANHTILSKGSEGGEVKYLQARFNAFRRSTLEVDGFFGSDTENQVKSFQKDNNIVVDGIVGRQTWNCLESTVEA